jgi:hypothetical protein
MMTSGQALANLHQTIVALQIASTLSVEHRLNLVVKSDSAYVQFECIYHTLTGWSVPNELPVSEQHRLTSLLVKVPPGPA